MARSRVQAVLALSFALVSADASAQLFGQDKPQFGDGWRRGAELLFDRDRDRRVYEDQLARNLELLALKRGAEAAQAQREFLRVQEETRSALAALWVNSGLPEEEARAVAQTFVLNDEQAAINARALRDGRAATLVAAGQAYRDYRYLLANQLVVAASRVPDPVADATQALAELDALYLKRDADYLKRRPLLSLLVAHIKATKPPAEWSTATAEAYESISALPLAEVERRIKAAQKAEQ